MVTLITLITLMNIYIHSYNNARYLVREHSAFIRDFEAQRDELGKTNSPMSPEDIKQGLLGLSGL